ncbi:MAG: sigma-54-dependent Fis family transcriptional regulator [Gammaproteobacteria bacterium]|nr:sigma-54-dependent Fis family transcriptional regulator [Gammaproteobacteria bacterium]
MTSPLHSPTVAAKILIVDDERPTLKNLSHILSKEGHAVTTAASGAAGLRILGERDFDLVLTDLRMEGIDGMAILADCKAKYPDTAVIMITGYASVDSAVNAVKAGAFHYIAKPFRLEEVRHLAREALEMVKLRKENRNLRSVMETFREDLPLVTQDAGMERLLGTARQIATSDCNLVISGESGTGKELLARYVHRYSRRRDAPFVAINCGAFTEDLLANELFGHEKGAYTGAADMRRGLIETASGGTLLLDEIAEMPPSMQVKLLRVIQEEEFYRLGAAKPVRVDVRFLAATNRDLREAVASGGFRSDLYYRLNVVNLSMPPLSDRPGDIPLIAHYFLRRYAALMDKPVADISPQAMEVLSCYEFPGNVRELSNLIERGVALATGTSLEIDQLPDDIRHLRIHAYRGRNETMPTLEQQESDYIQWVLEQTGGNRTRAAKILGIDRVSLWRKVKKYGLPL